MTDLGALYQSLILDHNRSPRNHREMPDADRSAEGRNPMCGDQVTVWVRVDGDRVADVSFLGRGCAISQASASLMTTMVKGKTRDEARVLAERFREMVMGGSSDAESLGRLAAFAGVARFPARVKCASLAWHALVAALASGETGR
jgi:nitrogen fixation NifU-like protein